MVRYSRAAISRPVRPCAMSRSTSYSRWVSSSCPDLAPDGGARTGAVGANLGSITMWPARTRCSAPTRSRLSVAASANFPTLVMAIFWRRFTTPGAVTSILVGTVSALTLVVIGPTFWGQRTQEPAPAVQPEQPGPGVYVAGLPQWHRGLTAMAGAGGVRQVRRRGAGDDPGQRRRNTRAVPDAGRAVADADEVTTGEAIMGRYAEAFRRSIDDPDGFWGEAAKAVDWYRPPTVVLDRSSPPFYRWFPDGVLNTCYNALDRHVAGGRADQLALVYDSPVTGTKRSFTYQQLLADVARFAGVLKGLGVTAGDRVVIYLPMVPEAVVAMLACARIGAVHSVVFGGFAAN